MWDLIKGLFKFLLSLVVITSVVVGVGVVAFAYIFKKDFEDIERKLKKSFQISKVITRNNINLTSDFSFGVTGFISINSNND